MSEGEKKPGCTSTLLLGFELPAIFQSSSNRLVVEESRIGILESVGLAGCLLVDKMLIRIGYDIALNFTFPTAVIHLLRVHPSRGSDLLAPERFTTDPELPVEEYYDRFGNLRGRVLAPPGRLRFTNEAVIRDSGQLDAYAPEATQLEASEIPTDLLEFLLPSRYCEVDSELTDFAWRTFMQAKPGWERVQAVCDFVHGHLQFNYQKARADRTALDAFRERIGVCRDFAHLAITLCRCLNIPARYATGYLGDIGVPPVPDPMDFSAWFQVYLQGQWYTFDARHNRRRIGRVLMGLGCDASHVPITMSFGKQSLETFQVITEEIDLAAVPEALVVKAA
jgi:transglutaminase-like putative cysteine protease